jgi:hypothetical protein
MSPVSKYREMCQKGDQENYLFDKYLFRPFSIYVTILFIKLRVRPNQVTFLSLLAVLSALAFLLQSDPASMLLAAGFIFLYHLLDHVDGEVARYRIVRGEQQPSILGQYYDVLVHSYSANLMLLFMSLGLYRLHGSGWIVLAGVVAAWGASGFPRLVAGRILLQKIARDPRSPVDDEHVAEALLVLERKKAQAAAVRGSGLGRAKLQKLMIEIIGYPGMLFLMIGALVLAALVPELMGWLALDQVGFVLLGVEPDLRLLLVIGAATVGGGKMVYLTSQFGRLLRPIS